MRQWHWGHSRSADWQRWHVFWKRSAIQKMNDDDVVVVACREALCIALQRTKMPPVPLSPFNSSAVAELDVAHSGLLPCFGAHASASGAASGTASSTLLHSSFTLQNCC